MPLHYISAVDLRAQWDIPPARFELIPLTDKSFKLRKRALIILRGERSLVCTSLHLTLLLPDVAV